jgi:hypothetical protein
MSSAPTPREIWQNARWLAQSVDREAGLVRFVEMTPVAYREASFLDDRMFQHPRVSNQLSWNDVAAAMPSDVRRDARWIFHIGRVGSTLIARLLGELDGVLSIREPRALRNLNFLPEDVTARYVPTIQALFSRTFASSETALVKTTSSVNEMARELMSENQPTLFLYTEARSFISGILAGSSRKELLERARVRARRAASRGARLPPPRSEADLAAAAWAAEMTALEAADGATVLWADFDRVLDGLEEWLRITTDFLGFQASDEQLREIARGPLTRSYSKDTRLEYGADRRRQLLSEAEERYRSEIDAALAMLVKAAETSPLLRKALNRAS